MAQTMTPRTLAFRTPEVESLPLLQTQQQERKLVAVVVTPVRFALGAVLRGQWVYKWEVNDRKLPVELARRVCAYL